MVRAASCRCSDTVRATTACGGADATMEQVVTAPKAAEADEFIREPPQGYDTVVGEQGLTLSGGQRQRVALARALITNPRLLLLDDATSAVDPRIEADIHATLHRVMQGRTTLLIAHRRSTLNLADRIAVLDSSGRVADIGTHGELARRCPLYTMLISGPGDDAEGIDAGDVLAPAGVSSAGNGEGEREATVRIAGQDAPLTLAGANGTRTPPAQWNGARAAAATGRGGPMDGM